MSITSHLAAFNWAPDIGTFERIIYLLRIYLFFCLKQHKITGGKNDIKNITSNRLREVPSFHQRLLPSTVFYRMLPLVRFCHQHWPPFSSVTVASSGFYVQMLGQDDWRNAQDFVLPVRQGLDGPKEWNQRAGA